MLQNASSLAIVAVDTEENEPIKNEKMVGPASFLGG